MCVHARSDRRERDPTREESKIRSIRSYNLYTIKQSDLSLSLASVFYFLLFHLAVGFRGVRVLITILGAHSFVRQTSESSERNDGGMKI